MNKLKALLSKIDGKGYKSYKIIEGSYKFPEFVLKIVHVQPDAYAPPSACKILFDNNFHEEFFYNEERKVAFEDYLNRIFYYNAKKFSKKRGSGKSGIITILKPSQCVLKRSSVIVNEEIEIRFYMGLPSKGRKILGKEAKEMFFNDLIKIFDAIKSFNHKEALKHVKCIEDANYIRKNLPRHKLVAFIANGSILPRKSGVEDIAMPNAIPFESPTNLEIEFDCPNRHIKGMGIKEGITLIVGGAYHGKSTLLEAMEKGVYNHVPGDGREFVITREDAVKIRAEDGRYVANVDISSFISSLPNGIDTRNFSTENASGSTSQAANICEALEIGSRLLLIDEDTSATNLMLRDRRMQELVKKEKEPITPIIDMIPSLKKMGVSIIMVAGGIGEYFDVADLVIMMDCYKPYDVTKNAKKIAKNFVSHRIKEIPKEIRIRERQPIPNSIKIGGKIKAIDIGKLRLGNKIVDLSKVEQIVEVGQVKAIGDIIARLINKFSKKCIREVLDEFDKKFLSILPPRGDYAEPRKYEVAFAINRIRGMKCKQRNT